MNVYRALLAGFVFIACAFGSLLVARGHAPEPRKREFHIVARQYAYEPHRIVVNKGDEVHISLSSRDVLHGFFLEGYDIDAEVRGQQTEFGLRHPSYEKEYRQVKEIVFTADKAGKFRYRCSHTCGYLHPFMLGEMIVTPNRLFPLAIGLVIGTLAAGLVYILTAGRSLEHTASVPRTEEAK